MLCSSALRALTHSLGTLTAAGASAYSRPTTLASSIQALARLTDLTKPCQIEESQIQHLSETLESAGEALLGRESLDTSEGGLPLQYHQASCSLAFRTRSEFPTCPVEAHQPSHTRCSVTDYSSIPFHQHCSSRSYATSRRRHRPAAVPQRQTQKSQSPATNEVAEAGMQDAAQAAETGTAVQAAETAASQRDIASVVDHPALIISRNIEW